MTVISKKQASKLWSKDRQILEQVEVRIDTILKERYRSGSYVAIDLLYIRKLFGFGNGTFKPALLNRLLADYRKKKWTVEVMYDQRDGDYLRFS